MSAGPMRGGIIAAGEGSRLRVGGSVSSKPMVRVAGRPLIAHAVDRFRAARMRSLCIIVNDASDDCRRWLEANCGDLDLDLIVRTTPSSYASFRIVAEHLAGAPAVIATVDSLMAARDFCDFVEGAQHLDDAVVLGLTGHVEDEAPLWATLDPAGGRICDLGGASGSHVTAGLYALPAQHSMECAREFERLRAYLAWLVATGRNVRGLVVPRVVDVDRIEDIAAAERMAAAWDRDWIVRL